MLRKTSNIVRRLFGLVLVCTVLVATQQTAMAQAPAGRSMIAFVTADRNTHTVTLNLVDPANGKSVALLTNGNFFYPMLSPDGRHIAFMGEHPQEGIRNVYVMDTDGSNLRLLFEAKPNAGGPRLKPMGQVAWSADSTMIFYGAVDGNRRPTAFFRLKLDGGIPERIMLGAEFKFFYSTWITASPDGKHIAIFVSIDERPGRQIYIANTDGSDAHRLASTTPDGQPIDEIVWSPDSQKTLLSTSIGEVATSQPVMIGDAEGANAKVLVSSPPNYLTSASWSPDGKQIAFLGPEPGDFKPDGDVWIANADGSGKRMLNIPIEVAYVGTSWSVIPDDVTLPSEPISFVDAIKK